MKNLILKLGTAVATIALTITTMNVNSTCMFVAHQPKLPYSAEKLRKF